MAKKIVITVNFASETLTKRQLSRHLQALVRDCLADCDEGELPDSMKVSTGSRARTVSNLCSHLKL